MKYPRTYHLPYSLGATNDDKKLKDDWFDYLKDQEMYMHVVMAHQHVPLGHVTSGAMMACIGK